MPARISGDHTGSIRFDLDNSDPLVVVGNYPRVAYVYKEGKVEKMEVGRYGFGTHKYGQDDIVKAREKYGVPLG